jgi:pimeloyl-ACP methyl ester carboxylesterase
MVFERITRQVFALDGNEYTYWVAGDSSNRPLVILYGYTGVHEDFLELVRALKQTFYVIIPEYPGWNTVPRFPEPLTIHNYAVYFKMLCDHLQLEQSITVIGHCVGSVVAVEMAFVYPQKINQLILISIPYLEGTWAQKMYAGLAKGATFSPGFIKSFFFLWRSRPLSVPLDLFAIRTKSVRKKMQRIKEHILKQPLQREDAVEEEWLSFIAYDFRKVRELTLPVHLIHGEKDLLLHAAQARRFQEIIPSATLDSIPDAGHVPPVETPRELIKIIEKYLV